MSALMWILPIFRAAPTPGFKFVYSNSGSRLAPVVLVQFVLFRILITIHESKKCDVISGEKNLAAKPKQLTGTAGAGNGSGACPEGAAPAPAPSKKGRLRLRFWLCNTEWHY